MNVVSLFLCVVMLIGFGTVINWTVNLVQRVFPKLSRMSAIGVTGFIGYAVCHLMAVMS